MTNDKAIRILVNRVRTDIERLRTLGTVYDPGEIEELEEAVKRVEDLISNPIKPKPTKKRDK